MQPKPFVEKGISLYLWAWALCHPDLGTAAPDGWLVTTVCVCMCLLETVSELLMCVCDLRTVWLQDNGTASLNEDKTRALVLPHVIPFCMCMCARMCGSVCLSSDSHHPPPLPCTHMANAISSPTLTRLAGLPSASWSAALMPVGCRNDSFCGEKKAQLFAHKVWEWKVERRRRQTKRMKVSPALFCTAASPIQFHGADLTKAWTRAPWKINWLLLALTIIITCSNEGREYKKRNVLPGIGEDNKAPGWKADKKFPKSSTPELEIEAEMLLLCAHLV